MATAYASPQVAANWPSINAFEGGGSLPALGAFPIRSGSAFVINDTVDLVKLPAQAVLTDYIIELPALDSSTGVVWSLLTTDSSPVTLESGQTSGRSGAGALVRMSTVTGPQRAVINTDVNIRFKITTAATGTAATTGTLAITIFYRPPQRNEHVG